MSYNRVLHLRQEGPHCTELPRSGKRQSSGLIASVDLSPHQGGRYRDKHGAPQLRLVFRVSVRDSQGRTRTERALFDSGAEANVVSQRLVKECGWEASREMAPLQSID